MTSASPSLAHVIPRAPASTRFWPIRDDLWHLLCGRQATPCSRQVAMIDAILASMMSRSRQRAGVSISDFKIPTYPPPIAGRKCTSLSAAIFVIMPRELSVCPTQTWIDGESSSPSQRRSLIPGKRLSSSSITCRTLRTSNSNCSTPLVSCRNWVGMKTRVMANKPFLDAKPLSC